MAKEKLRSQSELTNSIILNKNTKKSPWFEVISSDGYGGQVNIRFFETYEGINIGLVGPGKEKSKKVAKEYELAKQENSLLLAYASESDGKLILNYVKFTPEPEDRPFYDNMNSWE